MVHCYFIFRTCQASNKVIYIIYYNFTTHGAWDGSHNSTVCSNVLRMFKLLFSTDIWIIYNRLFIFQLYVRWTIISNDFFHLFLLLFYFYLLFYLFIQSQNILIMQKSMTYVYRSQGRKGCYDSWNTEDSE